MFHQSTSFISPKYEHRWLGLMLITLHSAISLDIFNALFYEILLRLLLGIHFVIFMLWQPLWGWIDSPNFTRRILLGILLLVFILFPNIWLISLWQIILLSLMGGRDLATPRDRIVNLTAILFLILELFTINIHQLFFAEELILFQEIAPTTWLVFKYGLLCIPITLMFISTDETLEYRYYVDFFHGLTFSMLIIIMILGSLVIKHYEQVSLPLAVFQMALAMAIFIFFVSWLWVVLAAQESIDQLWTRHLLNIGSAFEQWLEHLAQPSNYKNLTPQEFLRAGFEQLITLPWVSGITWHSLYGEDQLGTKGKYQKVIMVQSIEVTVHAHHRISGSQYFHMSILIQLLEHFHQAKRREAAFAQQAHLQAIHEAGAKLTHDIKNLLQSLHAITSVIETYPPTQFGDTQRLLQGQMPHLTQRLKRTLDKLQKPAEFSYSHVPVSLWWGNLKARYRKSNIDFSSSIDTENVLVPEDLFDNVSENLIQNALTKRKREHDLHIKVSLHINRPSLQLTVCDDGSPIPEEIVNNLLSQPVPSRDGFGIGLYQAVKQLTHTGYELNIIENYHGQVCFELASTE